MITEKTYAYQLLNLLRNYTELGMRLDLGMICDHFPTKQPKFISKELSQLKSKGLVTSTGSRFHQHYAISEKGVELLSKIEYRDSVREFIELMECYLT